MQQETLEIDDHPGANAGQRVLCLEGALVLKTMFNFQRMLRADESRCLIIDFAKVVYVDSAGIGALVGAYVSRQKGGRNLALVGVSDRVRGALQVTQVEQFFRFFESVSDAEQAYAA